ncbi:hypothetical protein E4U34_004052 [Claviceps purpurea]|nr:hypothetical protein E4U27_003611 [Claviceps purpurea]KAG6183167.1 hypothetical protein E4U36_002823 [Claviceps purpurea]KAG6228735.1 hypothetical protein E4U34_004052 [Claviceps purpurea]KAG6266266.1 hypothetical protein E4U49_000525 [Claviceps purpurea]KAG6275599.1 hypothetical protein E4U47_000709 [Claviceps purpurea]
MKVAVVLSLVAAVLAKDHGNCGCAVDGNYRQDVTEYACKFWVTAFPNSHWDGYSCVDKGASRGIDGTAFEAFCKMQYKDVFGGLESKVKGRCWH